MSSENWPLSPEALEMYRLQARRMWRPHATGGHLTRRMGQSLEFREYADYHLGDDYRHVDWQASWRRSGGQTQSRLGEGWLIRKFRAEEHYKLVISLDTRETMTYPRLQPSSRSSSTPAANISKLQMGRWLATAVAFVALRGGNEVLFHNLFGKPQFVPPLRKTGEIEGRIDAALETITAEIDRSETPNLETLHRYLPPTAVWLLITDFYFDLQKAQALAERINTAQDGMRWVFLVEMDSWPYERELLDKGPPLRLIEGPGLKDKTEFNSSRSADLDNIEDRIYQNKDAFLASCQRGASLVHWTWAAQTEKEMAASSREVFKTKFLGDPDIRSLFQRET